MSTIIRSYRSEYDFVQLIRHELWHSFDIAFILPPCLVLRNVLDAQEDNTSTILTQASGVTAATEINFSICNTLLPLAFSFYNSSPEIVIRHSSSGSLSAHLFFPIFQTWGVMLLITDSPVTSGGAEAPAGSGMFSPYRDKPDGNSYDTVSVIALLHYYLTKNTSADAELIHSAM